MSEHHQFAIIDLEGEILDGARVRRLDIGDVLDGDFGHYRRMGEP